MDTWNTTLKKYADQLGVSPQTLETALVSAGIVATLAWLPPAAKRVALLMIGRIAYNMLLGSTFAQASKAATKMVLADKIIGSFADWSLKALAAMAS